MSADTAAASSDRLFAHLPGGRAQFQAMMLDFVGGDAGVADVVAGMTRKELGSMPPYPFPAELFPDGTFPDGMRFSADGLASLPGAMLPPMDESEITLAFPSLRQGATIDMARSRTGGRLFSLVRSARWLASGWRRRPSRSGHQRTAGDRPSKPPAVSEQPVLVRTGFSSMIVPESDYYERKSGDTYDTAAAANEHPLHRAARDGDVSRLATLLSSGYSHTADGTDAHIRRSCTAVSQPDARGDTPLHHAAEGGHTGVALWLLDAAVHHGGADVHAVNADGWTSLHCAVQAEATEQVAALLIRHHADVHARTHTGRHAVTPLHVASFNGRLGAVKLLLAHGADAHAVDAAGFTPLDNATHWLDEQCACRVEDASRPYGAVAKLLQAVMPLPAAEALALATRSWGLVVVSALSEAAERADAPELSRRLACYGGHVNAKDHDGSTALHAAAHASAATCVVALLDARAEVGALDNLKDTPLHVAARVGSAQVVRLLLRAWWGRADDGRAAPARICRNQAGLTPLDLARRDQAGAWEEVVGLLLNNQDQAECV